MTPEKLYKYKNFKLKSKHIYAKKKLENIMNNILLNKLYGGAVPDTITTQINKFFNEEMIEEKNGIFDTNIDGVTDAFIQQLNHFDSILPDNDESKHLLTTLISADTTLNNEFKQIKKIMKNGNIVDDNTGILLKIQKSLFNLQAKIIFSSLTKIDKVNIQPLLEAFYDKFEAMNAYIQAQEDEFKKSDSKSRILQSKPIPNNPQSNENKPKKILDKIKKFSRSKSRKKSRSQLDDKSDDELSKKVDAVDTKQLKPVTRSKSKKKDTVDTIQLKPESKNKDTVDSKQLKPESKKKDAVDPKQLKPVARSESKKKDTDDTKQLKPEIINSADLYKYFDDDSILEALLIVALNNSIEGVDNINSENYSKNTNKINNNFFSEIFNKIVEKYKDDKSLRSYLDTDEKIKTIKFYLNNTTENIPELIHKDE